jgi:hypothetical protein
VPQEVLFGAEGRAKLAHATGPHGIHPLAVLATLCDTGRLRPRRSSIVLTVATLGYAAVFGPVTATAYAGRAPYDPTAPAWILTAGVLTVGTAAVAVLVRAAPPAGRRIPGPGAGKTPLVERTGR